MVNLFELLGCMETKVEVTEGMESDEWNLSLKICPFISDLVDSV